MDIKENVEDAARMRRLQRIKEMQAEKQRQMERREQIRKYAPYGAGAALLFLIAFLGIGSIHKVHAGKEKLSDGKEETLTAQENDSELNDRSVVNMIKPIVLPDESDLAGQAKDGEKDQPDHGEEYEKWEQAVGQTSQKIYEAKATSDTLTLGDEIVSGYAVMIDLDSRRILAGKESKTRINPASMTKILTVLVAAEHLAGPEALDDTFTMTLEITDYGYIHDCSSAGFEKDEEVTIRDLFYGTVLPSGADAAVALATYVAGDQEAFVGMMNEKLEQLGLSDTAHMTNCVGIYDEEHYCSVYDMAMILEAAIENDFCREVLSAHTYTTSKTQQHPDGIDLSNWFLRRIEDKDTGGEVVCGKTGFVNQSRNCAASYGVDHSGKEYICVTVNASNVWRCIEDHAALYRQFAQG